MQEVKQRISVAKFKFASGKYCAPSTRLQCAHAACVSVNSKSILCIGVQAAAVAARLAQSHGHSVNEDVKLPEKVAGLFQGRGSNEDELDHIQSVSNCKISLARDSGGLALTILITIYLATRVIRATFAVHLDRVISLNGSRESVNHAKELITNICSDNGATAGLETVSCILVPPLGPEGYPAFIEIMVPGSKVGLVIGKGGETIKTLQEKTGAKMVIIQDGPTQELVNITTFRVLMHQMMAIANKIVITIILNAIGKAIADNRRTVEDRARQAACVRFDS